MSEQEIIIEVGSNGEIVGPIGRKAAHDEYKLHAVAFIFIFTPRDEDAEIDTGFFQVRALNKTPYPGYLSSTAAGHIQYEPEKSLEELALTNAQRELEEETGLIDINLKLSAQGMLAIEGQEQQYLLVYKGRTDEVPKNLDLNEVAGMRQLTIKEFQEFVKLNKVSPFCLEALRLIGLS